MFYVFNEFERADFVFSFTKTEQLYRRIVSLSGNFIAGSKQRYTPLVSYYKSELWIGLKCRFICEAVFIQEADCVRGQIFLCFIKNYFLSYVSLIVLYVILSWISSSILLLLVSCVN